MIIRPETSEDIAAISQVTELAFADMPFSNGSEVGIIQQLRNDGDLAVSLVAEENAEIIGHIAFSPVEISGEDGNWFGLGPVSVHPDEQGNGIGSALVNEGLTSIRKMDAVGCVLIGDPAYYSRFGFISNSQLSYAQVPMEYVQFLAFNDREPVGEVTYAPAFENAVQKKKAEHFRPAF